MSRRLLEAAEPGSEPEYTGLLGGIADLMEQARRRAAGAVNSILTATYWEIGRQIVEFEQCGKPRAEYGQALLKRLAADLTARSGRGFSKSNLFQMRAFYQGWPILQTPSGTFDVRAIFQTPSGILESSEKALAPAAVSPEADSSPSRTRSDRKRQTASAESSGGIAVNVFASRYRVSLPDEEVLRSEILRTQRVIESRTAARKALP